MTDVIERDYNSPMSGFTKLWESIIHSTIWREEMHVKIVWITMLAMADARGCVSASVPGLADAARVSLDQCLDALARLSAPDPYSRTKDFEGRRIEEVDGGWHLLNHGKYRAMRMREERKVQVREAVRRHRRKKKEEVGVITDVIKSNGSKPSKPLLSQAEAEAEAEEEEEEKRKRGRNKFAPPTLEDVRAYLAEKKYTIDPEKFHAYYESNGWMVGKNKMKDWHAACLTWQKTEKGYGRDQRSADPLQAEYEAHGSHPRWPNYYADVKAGRATPGSWAQWIEARQR